MLHVGPPFRALSFLQHNDEIVNISTALYYLLYTGCANIFIQEKYVDLFVIAVNVLLKM